MTVCYWCGAKDTIADIRKEIDDGKYKMVQCKKCKTAYYVVNKEKMNKPKQITNEEWIKSCNTEQLAEVLNGISLESLFAGQMHDLPKRNGIKAWVEWLKKPHTSKE